jgi:hypothetical protein
VSVAACAHYYAAAFLYARGLSTDGHLRALAATPDSRESRYTRLAGPDLA